MPIRPENRDRYPADWKLRSRFCRFIRAKGRCEWCGVRQYSVGQWIEGDGWRPIRGNLYLDNGEYSRSYNLARAVADHHNEWSRTPSEPRYIVIVLTTAHAHDHRPEASSLLNLAALCQKCHNGHDADIRRRNHRRRLQSESKQLCLY